MTIESDPMSVTASVPSNPQRVPDVRLQRADGGTVSPVDFTGHELIVLFPPTDDSLAAQELRDYGCRLADFDKMDAWLLAVCDRPTPVSDLAVVHDSDGSAWQAMSEFAGPQPFTSRYRGAAFVIGRGGSLQRVYYGPGHAAEVFEEIGKRR